MGEVARKVIGHVRFALLSPDALSRAEQENNKKSYIPVKVYGANTASLLTSFYWLSIQVFLVPQVICSNIVIVCTC